MTVRKTPLGGQVMRDRSVALSQQQRSALILFDGKRTVEEVLRATSALGVTAADIEVLFNEGLLETDEVDVHAGQATNPGDASDDIVPTVPSALGASLPVPNDLRFKQALNLAIELVSNAGFKGFGLTLELTGVSNMERLRALAPEMQRVIGYEKFKPLNELLKP